MNIKYLWSTIIFSLLFTYLLLFQLNIYRNYSEQVVVENQARYCFTPDLNKVAIDSTTFVLKEVGNQACIIPISTPQNSEIITLYYPLSSNIWFPYKQINIVQKIKPEVFADIIKIDKSNLSINISNYFPEYTYSINSHSFGNLCQKINNLITCEIEISDNTDYVTIEKTLNNDKYKIFSASLITKTDETTILYRSDSDNINCKDSKCIVGYSQQNIPIEAYIYGTGEKKILLFGAIHGNERNSAEVLYKLIEDLKNNQINIPDDKQIIVIPILNIYGYNANSRFNSNGVDINRNFNSKDWQQTTYLTDQQVFPFGGGITPFSESESKVISSLILALNPYITISFHSWGKYIIPNSNETAIEMSKQYSETSKYVFDDPSLINTGFNYQITGTIDAWAEEREIPLITVELADLYNHDYENNKEAIIEVINY